MGGLRRRALVRSGVLIFMVSNRWFVAFAAIGMPFSAQAQQSPVDPGRIDERFRPTPTVPDVKSVELPQAAPAPSAAGNDLTVNLREVRFEGATVVPRDRLDALAAPFLNRDMPLAELFVLAEAVTNEYRRLGYVLSRAVVGPQRIENGVATMHIVEGHISKVDVAGDAGGYAPFLRGYLNSAAANKPTTGDALTRALLLARDLGGIETRAVLTPSLTDAGSAELSLAVKRDPVEGYVAIDNRGTRWLGPIQVYAGLTFNDGLGLGERISVMGVTAPIDRELGFVSATYDQPIGSSGLRFSAFGSYAATRPGDDLRVFDVRGDSATYGAALRYPLIRSREASLYARLAFTIRDSASKNIVLDPIFRDKTRTVQAELFGNMATPWGSTVSGRVSVTQGLGVLGATLAADSQKSRGNGSGEFTRVNFELSTAQRLAGSLYLQLSGAGQLSGASLLASEEFGLGGEQYGRAYDPSEITGDRGIAGRAELFYAASTPIGSVQPYAYYELGSVWQNNPLPGEARTTALRSAGAGLRLGLAAGLSGSVEYAAPLNRSVASRGNKDGRVFFSLSAAF